MTLWTVAYQAPLSMGFSKQQYWSGLPFPSSGDIYNIYTIYMRYISYILLCYTKLINKHRSFIWDLRIRRRKPVFNGVATVSLALCNAPHNFAKWVVCSYSWGTRGLNQLPDLFAEPRFTFDLECELWSPFSTRALLYWKLGKRFDSMQSL